MKIDLAEFECLLMANMVERPWAASRREGTITNPHEWARRLVQDTVLDYNNSEGVND